MKRLKRVLWGRRGEDTVEYALFAAFATAVLLCSLLFLRPHIRGAYEKIQAAFGPGGQVGDDDKGAGTPTDQ